ncbi:MAG: hypothetical protein NZL95_02525 [Chitinophagales bacterium]|nr:hypothetical protein [Chitinophagales bacterium]MDW8427408.1 hypothetical protein [Chitinophagales bacterium]
MYLTLATWCLMTGYSAINEATGQDTTRRSIRRILEYQVHAKGHETLLAERTYNPMGWLIEEAEYDESGKLKQRIAYEYDARGLKIRETTFDADGRVVEVRAYEYDASGNRIRRTVTDGAGRIKSQKRMVYEYHQ